MPKNILWIASSNEGKVREFQSLLSLNADWEIHHQGELDYYSSPEETGSSFKDNAHIKAKFLHALKKEAWVLADDSGLEVEGLNGLPGVHSARYAGPKATDPENRAKLLKMMQIRQIGNRNAQFVCILCLISPSKDVRFFEGYLKGEIAKKEEGTQGFGYDSIFRPSTHPEKTLAQLTLAQKNEISHRSMAINLLKDALTIPSDS